MRARPRWPRASLVLSLLLSLSIVGACSVSPRVASELPSIDASALAERTRLGHLGTFGEHPEGAARAREAAALALELGNYDEAAELAREQLDLARVELLTVALADTRDDPEAREHALDRLDDAARFALRVGDEILDGKLVVESAQFLRAPRRERQAIERALAWTDAADIAWGYERLWSAFERDAEALAALQRLRWRAFRSPGLPTHAPRLSPESLGKLGVQSLDLIRSEANAAALEHRREDFVRWIGATLDADPLDIEALAAKAVLEDLERGELDEDDALLPDLAHDSPDPLGSHARMLLRHRELPHSRALALARAAKMVAGGTFGDAAELLATVEAGGSDTEERLRETLAAMTELERGTEEGRDNFTRWARRARAHRSSHVLEWLSNFEQQAAPEGHVELAQEADRELVTRGHGQASPRLDLAILGSVAVDKDAPKSTRARAFTALSARKPTLGAKLAICRERKIFGDDCRDLVSELGKLDAATPAYGEGLDALDHSGNVRSSWFEPVPWLDGEQLPRVREQLVPYEGTRVAATTDFQTAALFAELAANRPDLARARIEGSGALLTPETRAVAAMALADLEDGLLEPRQLPELLLEVPPADVDASWFLERWLPGDPAMVEELFPGRSRLARFARGLALARMGAWQRATSELMLTVEDLSGQAKGVVAGRLALVAQLAGENTLRDRALTLAEAEDPHGFMSVYVRGRIAENAEDRGHAHQLYLQALARRPRSSAAFEGVLRTLPLELQELHRVREALLLFPDAGMRWNASELIEAATAETIDGPQLTRLWLARDDANAALALGEIAATVRPTADLGLELLLEELSMAQTPADAFPLAARALAWLSAMPPDARVRHRAIEIWLTFLVSRDEDLVALTQARPRVLGLLQPSAAHHATLLLAEARQRGAVDDLLAWALVRSELWGDQQDPNLRQITSLFYNANIEDPALAQYACLYMFQRDEFELAAERCVPLWNDLGGSPFLAVDLAFLSLNDPELVRAHGLDLASFFATAESMTRLAEDPVWLLNASLWASKQGDDERGAALRVEQLRLESIAPEPDELELGQGRHRGALLRQQIVDQFDPYDRRRFALAAGSAVRSLHLDAAEAYASRLLAWLPPEGDAHVPDFTAEAPELLAASRREGDTSDAELRSMALYALDISSLVRDDLAHDRIPRTALLELFDAYAEDRGLASYERIASDHPDSHVAKLLLLGDYREARMREQALPLARELVELHPTSPLILADALPLLTGPEDLERAKKIIALARTLHPEHPWLSDEALPAVLTGADDRIPAWLRTPESFDRKLASADASAVAALDPRRRAAVDASAEAFFPAAAEVNPEGLGVRLPIPGEEVDPEDPEAVRHSRVQFVVREPRASRCEGMGCAEPLIAEWTARNYALLWARELELPAGPAIEFVVVDGESVIDNLLVPTGGNLFVLISGTTPEDVEGFIPQLQLLRESFRPLDWSLSAPEAETLRAAGRAMPDDELRLLGRRLLAAAEPGHGCVLTDDPALAKLDAGLRGELLLDLLLTTREAWQRRSLLSCTTPKAPAAARIALLTLLDADAAVHEFGRAATELHGEHVVTDTRRLLYQDREAAVSDPNLTTGGNQPPFGVLQVIAALPHELGRALTTELLGRRDPRLRALALAASSTMDYFDADSKASEAKTEVERLLEVLREGEAKEALVASRSVMDIPGRESLAAIRERADTLIAEGVEDPSARGLALDLAWALARALEGKDKARLAKLAKAVNQDPADERELQAKNTRKAIEQLAEDHAKGRKLLAKRTPATNDERATHWVRRKRARPEPRTTASLRDTPLAELVPGKEWTFVRVADAGLFATSLEGLLRRLAPAKASDAYLVRALIYDMLLQGSFALLAEEGGLDLSKPIECASPKGSEGFVCSATVRDREAVLSTLAMRELGDDAGVAIPLSLVTEFAGLPMTMGLLPVVLHTLVESPEDEFESSDAAMIAAERLRTSRTIAGHELEYYATIEIHEDHMTVDSEHYLFVGDRVLVFGGAELAEQVLRQPPAGAQTLAEAPAFAAAVAEWKPGVALQAVDLSEDLGLDEVALEVVFDSHGIEFSASVGSKRDELGDPGQLEALLPPDEVTRAVLPLEQDALEEYFEDVELERCEGHGGSAVPAEAATSKADTGKDEVCGLAPTDKMPPVALAKAAHSVILGWYPNPGDSLWQRWVMVLPLDARLRRALAKLELELEQPGEILTHGGLSWLERDGALVIASTVELAEAAARQTPGSDLPASRLAAFDLEGQRAAAVTRELAARYEGERRGDYLRLISTMIGLVDQVSLRGEWSAEGERAQLDASIRLNLAESEEELALIDRWLANPEVGNASKLPRHLGHSETQGGLSYTIRVHDAESFARTSVPDDNARISVEVLGPDQLRLTVLPSQAVPAKATNTLTTDERERMLDSDQQILASNSKIRDRAKALRVSGNPAATVDAVVSWVHENVSYEITPTSLDAVSVLERGAGDCTEYALLTVTLLRAAGIPAELREGMAAQGDEMVAHAWAAWHDGTRWREVDPTAGTSAVGSGHLELEVVDVLAMISLGEFEVVAIDPV